jgi:hypothetical protein
MGGLATKDRKERKNNREWTRTRIKYKEKISRKAQREGVKGDRWFLACPLYYNEQSSNILTRIHALAKTK